MALPDNARIGRSQGASIFWGLVSVFFAAAACFYFWQSHENEATANKWRDEALNLQDERDSLKAQTDKLEAGQTQADADLKTRADFLQDKENKLAAEEARLDALAQKATGTNAPTAPPPSSSASKLGDAAPAFFKKFGETLKKLGADNGSDVVMRGGRPVLRAPNSLFFAPGDASLKSDGKTFLGQIAQALSAQADNYELRVETFTETDAEIDNPADTDTPKPSNVPKKDDAKAKPTAPRYATSWDLTAARAAALARYFRDETSLPFQNVLVLARGDSEPIVTGAKEGHLRNRRIEITLAPVPPTFHTEEPVNPLAPPPDSSAPAKAK